MIFLIFLILLLIIYLVISFLIGFIAAVAGPILLLLAIDILFIATIVYFSKGSKRS